MNATFPRSLLALALTAGIAGCETTEQMAAPAMHDEPSVRSVFDYNDLMLVAGGYNPLSEPSAPPASVKDGSAFPNPQAFVNTMSRVVDGCPNPTACYQMMRAQGEFDGLAGTSSRFFGQVSLELAATENKPDFEVTGRITETCLNDPSQPGYQYDSSANTARFCVITRSVLDRGNRPPVYQYYDVSASNVGVAPRVGDSFPQAAQATGLDVVVPSGSAFNHKLYAAGNDIQVTAYWVTQKADSMGNPDWLSGAKHSLPSGLPIFQPNPDSCIDMLFEGPPPPTLPPDYQAGVKYCLGRCETPPIVNTM